MIKKSTRDAVYVHAEGVSAISGTPLDAGWEVDHRQPRSAGGGDDVTNLQALTAPLKGYGENPKRVEALLKDDAEALRMFREATTAPHGGDRTSKSDNITLAPERGTDRAYTLSRLKRQSPELYEQVVAGTVSAHAAAIQAGFRRRSITHALNVDGFVRAIQKHLSDDERAAVKRAL
jgi:hypothetical protein